MKKLVLALSVLVWMCGCGGAPPSTVIVVSINPSSILNIDQGQTAVFSASLAGNNTSGGIAWSVTGTGCAGTTCGTVFPLSGPSTTYTAPSSVSAALALTVTATSTAQTGQTASTLLNVVPPPSVITTNLPYSTPNSNYILPNATPNEIYYNTVQAVGGVQPLNWSLASGKLPTGVTLNSTGVLYGVPTVPGTYNFTVKVADSSQAPGGTLSSQQALSITVEPILTIPAASLPNATVGIPYSAAIPSTGGLPPLTWSLYSGSLPSGLALQPSSGVISGTPTLPGTTSFIVEVVDSSPVQQYFYSSTLTLTVNPSGPLTIRTTSMLDGTVGAAYQGQLAATGGAPPLGWTITAGELPPGLALNPQTGAISGVPAAPPATYSFDVKVSDNSSPQQTASQQLSITINPAAAACSSSGNNSALVGQYAFSLRGYNGQGFLAVVGSFTADGNGHMTAGEADTNGVLGAQNGNLITGASSYSVGPDNRGCATLATPFGTFSTRFALGGLASGIGTQGRIIEFDSPGASAYIASGQIFQQSPSAFLFPLTGSFALRTAGWDPSTSSRVACAGLLTAGTYQFSFLEQDCNDHGTVTNSTNTRTITNTTQDTYTTADANGRATGILLISGNISDITFYWVSATQLLMLNADPGPFYSGDWLQINVPVGTSGFNQASFTGNVASYASGTGPFGAGGAVSIATETADGSSSVSSQIYQDSDGAWQTTSTTCNYTVVLIGRITLNPGGSCGANPPIPYLNSLDTAFVLGTDSTIQLGSFELQTTGLNISSLAGTYFVGTSEVVSQSDQAEVGVLTLTSTGIVTSTSDAASTLSQTIGTAGTDTYSLNSNGTISTRSSGGTTVGIAISGSKFVIANNPMLTFPTLLVGQH